MSVLDNMVICVSDDNTEMGYIVYEHETDAHLPIDSRKVFVHFWTMERASHTIMYNSNKALYEDMNQFVVSPLANHSELHKVKAIMGKKFIQYFEERFKSRKVRSIRVK